MIDKLALREVIASLDEREQEIIKLRYFNDRTQTDIAKELVSQRILDNIELIL